LSEERPLKLPSDYRKAINSGEKFLRDYASRKLDRPIPSPEADTTPYSSNMSKSCRVDMRNGQNGSTESEQGTSREKNTFSSDIIGIDTDEQDTSGESCLSKRYECVSYT
jgi:hypothetical protein